MDPQCFPMGWLRLVCSFQLQVSFAKEPYKRDLHSAKETHNFKEPADPQCFRNIMDPQCFPNIVEDEYLPATICTLFTITGLFCE